MQTEKSSFAQDTRWTIQNPGRLILAIAFTVPFTLATAFLVALVLSWLLPEHCARFEGEEPVMASSRECP